MGISKLIVISSGWNFRDPVMRKNHFNKTCRLKPCRPALTVKFMVLLLTCLIILLPGAKSQRSDSLEVVDVSKIRVALSIVNNCRIAFFSPGGFTIDSLSNIRIHDTISNRLRRNLAPELVEKIITVRFSLSNHSDSVQEVFFFPGCYFESIRLLSLIHI